LNSILNLFEIIYFLNLHFLIIINLINFLSFQTLVFINLSYLNLHLLLLKLCLIHLIIIEVKINDFNIIKFFLVLIKDVILFCLFLNLMKLEDYMSLPYYSITTINLIYLFIILIIKIISLELNLKFHYIWLLIKIVNLLYFIIFHYPKLNFYYYFTIKILIRLIHLCFTLIGTY